MASLPDRFFNVKFTLASATPGEVVNVFLAILIGTQPGPLFSDTSSKGVHHTRCPRLDSILSSSSADILQDMRIHVTEEGSDSVLWPKASQKYLHVGDGHLN